MTSRIALATDAAQSAAVVPLLLISGINAVYVPEGVTFDTFTTGSDTAWWPGVGTPGVPYATARAHLRVLSEGLVISERAQPVSRTLDIGAVAVGLADPALATTAVFSQRDSLVQTLLTAEVGKADATISVVSTSGFQAAPADIAIGREVIRYTGTTATSFTGCARAKYGSVAARHPFATTTSSTIGTAVVYGGSATYPIPVPSLLGRRATIWLARRDGQDLYRPTMVFDGRIGAGTRLTDDGAGWLLQIDHVSRVLSQPMRERPIHVGGYAHPGNLSCRGAPGSPPSTPTPVWYVLGVTGGATSYRVLLTGDANEIDSGGWHASRELFVQALDRGAANVDGADRIAHRIEPDGRLSIETSTALTLEFWIQTEFAGTRHGYEFASTRQPYRSADPMPEAWVPVQTDSPVFVSVNDYNTVPAVPGTLDSASNTSGYYTLVIGDDRRSRAMRITGKATSGSSYYLTCTRLARRPEDPAMGYDPSSGGPTGTWWIIREPTNARLGLNVQTDRWDRGLRYGLFELDSELGEATSDAIEWDRTGRHIDAASRPISPRRQYEIDTGESVMDVLGNEATINGLSLATWYGRLALVQMAEHAATETLAATVVAKDLDGDPLLEEASDSICNTYSLELPDGRIVNVTDADSLNSFGASRTVIKGKLPPGAINPAATAPALYDAIFSQGAMVLGPWRYPYETVTLRLPLIYGDVQMGDLVRVTEWQIPNRSRGRGLVTATTQVIGRTLTLFEDGRYGHVELVCRLNPPDIAGYAPSAFLSAAVNATGVCTLDTAISGFSTWNFAQDETVPGTTRADGGASTFVVGDKVKLVEIDNTSPTAATSHTVTAVSGSTVTIDPVPSATFETLAATQAKVMICYDDWEVATAVQKASGYAWLGESATLQLDSNTGAKRWAA